MKSHRTSKVIRELKAWRDALLRAIPGELGCAVRRRWGGFAAGPRCRVLSGVHIYHPENLTLGANVGVAVGCQLNAAGGITIGDNTLIGPGTTIWSQNHVYLNADRPIIEQGHVAENVTIEDDVWVAARCVILPGVVLAKGTVVAAGAVVTRSTQPYSVVAGVPAKPIDVRSNRAPSPRQTLGEDSRCHPNSSEVNPNGREVHN